MGNILSFYFLSNFFWLREFFLVTVTLLVDVEQCETDGKRRGERKTGCASLPFRRFMLMICILFGIYYIPNYLFFPTIVPVFVSCYLHGVKLFLFSHPPFMPPLFLDADMMKTKESMHRSNPTHATQHNTAIIPKSPYKSLITPPSRSHRRPPLPPPTASLPAG